MKIKQHATEWLMDQLINQEENLNFPRIGKNGLGMVVHAFNSSSREAEVGGSLFKASSTYWVVGHQPRLHSETSLNK